MLIISLKAWWFKVHRIKVHFESKRQQWSSVVGSIIVSEGVLGPSGRHP